MCKEEDKSDFDHTWKGEYEEPLTIEELAELSRRDTRILITDEDRKELEKKQ